ncbi:MAG: hypothetical protein SGJ20_08075 [Planctomycetota bacterium]|nr:hypothetical protein [Planctomycetota bacterium]
MRDAVLAADARPSIGVRLTQATINPDTWRIEIDGLDVTGLSQRTATEVIFVPTEALSEASHSVRVSVGDDSVSWNFISRTPPEIAQTTPLNSVPEEIRRPEISASYSDIGAGIDPASVEITVDGVNVASSAQITADAVRFTPATELPDGERFISVRVGDLAGNISVAAWSFLMGPVPQITFQYPVDGQLLPYSARPEVSAMLEVTRGELDPDSVVLFLNDQNLSEQATISIQSANSLLLEFQPNTALENGSYSLYAEVTAVGGRVGFGERLFNVDIERTYLLELVSPSDGSVLLSPQAPMELRVNSTSGAPSQITIGGSRAVTRRFEDGNYIYSKNVECKRPLTTPCCVPAVLMSFLAASSAAADCRCRDRAWSVGVRGRVLAIAWRPSLSA